MAEKKTDKRQAARQSLMSAAASAEAAQTKAQGKKMQTGFGNYLKRKNLITQNESEKRSFNIFLMKLILKF